MCFGSIYNSVGNVLHSKKKRARYDTKYVLVFMYGTGHFCTISMILGIARQIFEKYSNIKFREIIPSGNRVVPYGQTDRDEDANGRFSQFCERP